MANRNDRAKSQRRRVMTVCFLLRLFLSFAAVLRVFVRPTVIGRPENIPTEGPVIFAFNHRSIFDVIAIFGALKTRKDLAFLATSGLFIWPAGPILKWMGHIPVRRGTDAAVKASNDGIEALQTGAAVALSFEGGISDDMILREPKKGTAFMAQATGAPVVPVIVVGTERVKPPGTPVWRWRFFQRYVVLIGRPVRRPEIFGTSDDAKQAWRAAMSHNIFVAATQMVDEGEAALAAKDKAALAA